MAIELAISRQNTAARTSLMGTDPLRLRGLSRTPKLPQAASRSTGGHREQGHAYGYMNSPQAVGSHFTIITAVPVPTVDRIANSSMSFRQPGIPAPGDVPTIARSMSGIPAPES